VRTRRIGSLVVSEIALGCNSMGNDFGRRLDQRTATEIVHAALDSGVTLFDTSDSYGDSEIYLGNALSAVTEDVVVATKFGERTRRAAEGTGGSRGWIRTAVERSLKRLQREHIDLYQMHYPDPDVPISETLEALTELVRAGKIREFGCSNFSPEQLRDASTVSNCGSFASCQDHLNLLRQDNVKRLLPLCDDLGLAFLPYFPLASGALTGKYLQGPQSDGPSRLNLLAQQLRARGVSDGRIEAVAPGHSGAEAVRLEALAKFAVSQGRSMTELAFAWLLSHQTVSSVIAGASSANQIRQNARTAGSRPMSPEEAAAAAETARSGVL
jgi:aryl-alcohol dehydrogenase-like predicted oxidoreductase